MTRMPGRPPFSRVWPELIAPVVLVLTPFLVIRPITDPSPWLHLRVGEFLRSGHRFGSPDPWAPFTDRHYTPTQWLPEMVISFLVDHFGLAAVPWSRVTGVVLILALVYGFTRVASNPWVALATTGLAVGAAWPTLTERPQLLGFAFLVAITGLWQACARDGRPRWLLIPLSGLLACTHGVWSLGLAVGAVCVLAVGWHRRGHVRLLALWLGCLAITVCTPLGLGLLSTPAQAGGNGRAFVVEWFPSSARDPNVICALAMIVLLIAVWLWQEQRPAAWELILLVVSIALALAMRRTVPVAAFILAPMLATALTMPRSPREHRRPSIGTARMWASLTVAAAIAIGAAVPLAAHAATTPPRYVPLGVEHALRDLPDGTRIVAEGDVTGWVLYAAPNTRPVFDLRIEVYSAAHVQAFIDAMAARPGWADFITTTRPDAALLLASAPLAVALRDQSGWRAVAQDRGFVLLVRP
jgi:hypothetical protein